MKLLITIFSLFLFFHLQSQQLDLTTLYRYNWQILNPAATNYIKIEDKYKENIFNASAYTQRITGDFAIDPHTFTFRYEHYPQIKSQVKLKLGAFAVQEKAAAVQSTKANINIAVILPLTYGEDASSLSVGLNLGGYQQNIDMSDIKFANGQIPDNARLTRLVPDASAGIFYQYLHDERCVRCEKFRLKKLYAGISILQLFNFPEISTSTGDFYIAPEKHIYFLTGVVVPFLGKHAGEQNTVEVSTWIRHVPRLEYITLNNKDNTISADLNMRVNYGNLLWGGVGVGTNKLGHTEFGVVIKDRGYVNSSNLYLFSISFGYSFPIGWERLRGEAYEINVGYAWK